MTIKEQVKQGISCRKSIKRMSEEIGCTRRTVAGHWDRLYASGEVGRPRRQRGQTDNIQHRTDFRRDEVVAEFSNVRIVSLEDLLATAQVDLNVWEVDRHVVNKWEVGARGEGGSIEVEPLYQVKIWLKRKVKVPAVEGFRQLVQEITPATACVPQVLYAGDRFSLEISLLDHHFGKLAWGPETGDYYDLKIAEQLYRHAIAACLNRAKGYNLSEIVLPIGSDFFQIDNQSNTTSSGTPQDVDGRLPKIFKTGFRAVMNAVDVCAKAAPVQILWVPGNHDETTSYFLCEALAARYIDTPHIEVDVSPKRRKYRMFGNTLVGYTHGHAEKHADLPLIMANEEPGLWALSTYREMHVGHWHKKKETKYTAGDSIGGVSVHVLPSLCGTDKWHYQQGFISADKACEAFLYHETFGKSAQFQISINELKKTFDNVPNGT